MSIEDRLREALASDVRESPDLFVRVQRSLQQDARRRQIQRRLVVAFSAGFALLVVFLSAVTDHREGQLLLAWWILELLVTALLAGLTVVLGPFIKRFGRGYAADVFRLSPDTGAALLTLLDVAYYLIFGAYVVLTATIQPPPAWDAMVNASQLGSEAVRVGGMLLLMGLLHGANLLLLPVVGRLLGLNRRLERDIAVTHSRSGNRLSE